MASSTTISPDQLESALETILEDFTDDAEKDIERAVRRVGKETAAELKRTSPRRNGSEVHYADGWRSTVERDGYGGTVAHVHNTTKPSLTHLLEFGHGGPAPARAYPHIEPAYEKGKAKLEQELMK